MAGDRRGGSRVSSRQPTLDAEAGCVVLEAGLADVDLEIEGIEEIGA